MVISYIYADNFRKTCHFQVTWIPTFLLSNVFAFLLTSTNESQMHMKRHHPSCEGAVLLVSNIIFLGCFLGKISHFPQWKHQKHFYIWPLRQITVGIKHELWTTDGV